MAAVIAADHTHNKCTLGSLAAVRGDCMARSVGGRDFRPCNRYATYWTDCVMGKPVHVWEHGIHGQRGSNVRSASTLIIRYNVGLCCVGR